MGELKLVSSGRKELKPVEFEKKENFGFNILLIKRFLIIHRILFKSLISVSVILYFLLMLTCILEEYVINFVGKIPSKYYAVLPIKDKEGFYKETINASLLIVAIASVKSIKEFMAKYLTVEWRKLITKALHRSYFTDSKYYHLNVVSKLIDNPDQRITQEVDEFTTVYGDILPKILIAPFVIGYYSYKNYDITGWQGPVAIYIFFGMGSIINKFLMTPVIKFTVKFSSREGDYRFLHLLVRSNAESIAFHDGSKSLSKSVNNSLQTVAKTQRKLYIRQFFLNLSINLYNYIGSILSYIILAVPIFNGSYNNFDSVKLMSLISENSFQSMYLIYAFSNLVSCAMKMTEVAGVSHRISQLIERMEEIKSNDTSNSEGEFLRNEDRGSGKTALILTAVSYKIPQTDNYLIKNLNLQLNLGESLLVMGPSSAGKTSFLRVLRGLWENEGKIERFWPPGPTGCYFLPQKPILTCGSLREQISFPLEPNEPNEEENEEIMKFVKLLELEHVVERFGGLDEYATLQMYSSLSPGETQRICFLRLFYHKPLVGILDEATSALPEETERIIYEQLQKLKITTLSVGHRNSLKMYHEKLLKLENGGWEISEIVNEQKPF